MRALAVLALASLIVVACGSPSTGRGDGGAGQAPSPSSGAVNAAAGGPPSDATDRVPGPLPDLVNALYSSRNVDSLVFYVADRYGLWKDEGLPLNLSYAASTTADAALIAGHADVLAGGGPAAVAAIGAGADWLLIAGFFNSTPFRLMAEPGVNSAAALRGKRIGTARPGSVTDMTARIAVERLGLNPERDVEFISMSDVRVMLAALQSGAVQAGVAYPPDTAPLEDAGYHTLYDPAREAFPFQHKAVVVRRDWVTQYPAAADRVVRGVARAIHYIRTNREETMAALAEFIGVTDRRGLEESYDEVILPLIPELPIVSREGTQWIVDFMARANPEIASVDVDRIIDNSWVNRLADSGYVARLYGR